MPELQLSSDQASLIGLKIREIRLQQGLQQKDLVQGQFSKSYISLIESGRVLPSSKALNVIAQRLGMSIEQLLSTITPGSGPNHTAEGESEIFSRWDLVLDEARLFLSQHAPEQARAVLTQKVKTRQLSSDQLKNYHFLMANTFLEGDDIENALNEYKVASQMARSLGDAETEARINQKIGSIYFQQGKYLQAVEIYRRALDLIFSLAVQDLKFKHLLFSSIGDCHQALGDQKQAIQFYSDALDLAANLKDYNLLATNAWKTSQAYRELNNLAMAKLYTGKALALYEANDTLRNITGAQSMLGYLLTEKKEYEQAQPILEEALRLANQMGEKRLAAMAGLRLSNLYRLVDRTADSLAKAEESVNNAQESGDQATIGQALSALAQAHMQSGDAEQARKFFVQSLEQLEQTQNQDILSQTYFEYGQVLSQLGRTEEALRAMEKAYHLQVTGRPVR